jgi:hypothetical protein
MKHKTFVYIYLILFLSIPIRSSIDDYIYPYSSPSFSEYGTPGLIRMPSARFHEEGTLAFVWSKNDPYTRGSIVAYPFDWFQASYQYTDVGNALYSDVESFSGDQTYKDKGFDVKFRLWKETENLPSVAIGIRDIAGTGTFAAEYLVASKFIDIDSYFGDFNYLSRVDLTLGLGWGDMSNNKFSNPLTKISDEFSQRTLIQNTKGGEFSPGRYFSGPMGIFAGIEVPLPNLHGLRLKLEYDATDYTEEGFPFGRESFPFAFKNVKQSQSRINAGFTLPINDYVQIYGAVTKGNTISFGFSLQGGFGPKDPIIKKNDPYEPIRNAEIYQEIAVDNDDYMMVLIMNALDQNKIYLQKADRDGDEITVLYAQNKFISHALASGRAARVLDEVTPYYIKKFHLQNINAGMILHDLEVDRESFHKYKKDKIYNLAAKEMILTSKVFNNDDYSFQPVSNYPHHFWTIEPDLKSQIGGPDGFYFGDLRLAFKSELQFKRNLSLITEASVGIYNNFGELKLASDSIIPHVRTDIVSYLKGTTTFGIKRVQLNYFKKLSPDIYSKISLGIFEDMFGGIGGEVLYRPYNQSFAIGAEVWSLKQRDYDQLFEFRDYQTESGHINLYYKEPYSNVILAVKGGKFLAGDSGLNFDFSRRFKSGLRIGGFFSVTDISKEEFGEGSFDKGFYFTIPIEAFFTTHTRNIAAWGLRPLTRDGASYVQHSHHLWGLTEPGQSYGLSRDWDDIYD